MITQIDSYIETFSGKKFYFLKPSLDDIVIEDIAHSLSMQCRYTGHASEFYSIAEHSILVSSLCSDDAKLWGLMHDASEAYLTDVASPIKPYLVNYKKLESNIMNAVCDKFSMERAMPGEVHVADMEVLRCEAHMLMHSQGKDWKVNENNYNPLMDLYIECLSPKQAKEKFLERFYELKK